MQEHTPTQSPEVASNDQEKQAGRERQALQEAFAPSGVSGERLEAVAATFDKALDSGQSYDAAINSAILEAKVLGSSPVELKSYFWDNMDPNRVAGEQPTCAIDRALSGFDLDDEKLKDARMAYTSALLQKWQYVNDWEHGGKVDDWERSAVTEGDITAMARLDYPIDAALLHATNEHGETPANKAARERFYAGIDPNKGRDDQPKNKAPLHLGGFAAAHTQ